MKKFITQFKVPTLTVIALLFCFVSSAHQVDAYSATCNGSSQYAVTATMSSNNSSSNYRWQWKNPSGSWICFVNGTNNINGTNYNVTNAVVNLTNLTTQTMTFTNPGSGLQNLEMRMVISDGAGVNPCTTPSGNTWTNASGVSNHFINITATNCATCIGAVHSLYFNELSGGTDIAITNGGTYTIAQLGSLYNLEAGFSGTVGSMVFTVTGPTSGTNTENVEPYNYPGTGSGAFVPSVGTYTVNVKSYNGSSASGRLCGEINITFNIISNNCNCTGTNLVLNPGFENGTTSWSSAGGTLTSGTGAVACETKSGDLENTSTTSKAWQVIGTDLAVGTVINASVYAGTHDASFDNYVAIEFLNASNVILGTSVYTQVNKILANAPAGPQLYTFSGTVPTGTKFTRVAFGGNGSWTKTDRWCVTKMDPPPTNSLGNRVWNDINKNGIDDSEPGLAGVVVKLYLDANNDNIADGVAVATTTTNANGNYLFSNLSAGNYIVGAMMPAGFMSSNQNGGDPDNNLDLDDNGQLFMGTGEIRGLAITLSPNGEPGGLSVNNTYDFGFYHLTTPPQNCNSTATTSGGSSVQFLGVTYTGTGTNIKSTYTYMVTSGCSPNISHFDFGGFDCLSCMSNSSNFFSVNGSGSHSFGTDPNTGICGIKYDYEIACNASNTVSFTLNGFYGVGQIKFGLKAGQNVEYADICGPVCSAPILNLGDFVWYDVNNNGIQDAGEPGIAGATVRLYADVNGDNIPDGAALGTTTTGANGNYSFSSLTDGNYIVGVTTAAGYAQGATTATSASPNNDDLRDNNGVTVVAGEVRSNFITLTTGGEPTTDGDGNNSNLTLDFGFKGTATIGDFVWNDLNGNGIQDAGEPGLEGVTVILKNAAGATLATTTSSAVGAYSFVNLVPGTYSVTFVTPINLVASPSKVTTGGGNDTNDSDPVGGVVSNIVLIAGQTNNNIDAGFYSNLMAVGDRVFYDLNNNGVRESATENGIPNLTVNLYLDANNDNVVDGAAIATTTTDANGAYLFTGLAPNNYIVGVTPPAGYISSTNPAIDPDNNVDLDDNGTNLIGAEWRGLAITLAPGTEPNGVVTNSNTNITYDFGFFQPASIGDFVWNDLNGNGTQDAGEPGLAGVTVTLKNAAGATVGTVTTTAAGAYSFTNLAPGTYSVTFAKPINFNPTPSNLGADDTKDSDPIAGVVSGIVLSAGQINNTVDAGFFKLVNLYGNVWHDANGMLDNQVNKTSNVAIPVGLNIYLVDAATNIVIDFTSTETDGTYNFIGIMANKTYRVVLSSVGVNPGQQAPKSVLPTGWRSTGENVGAGPGSGSDGVSNGLIEVDVEQTDVLNVNFGIRIVNGEVVIG